MTYEEKYKEALEKIKKIYNQVDSYGKELMEKEFQEFLESEDERMREMAIKAVYAPEAQSCIKSWGINPDDVIAWLEKQCVQKPTDKVEPKFKVSDWIVTPNGETKQIEKVGFGNYYFTDKTLYNIIDVDNKSHLWTIQDAKDGDVLVAEINAEPNDFIYIFKEYDFQECDKNLGFWSHCYLDAFINEFHKGIYHNSRNVGVPATKEQRDLLFQKMKEAGYEWDANKKELKKIEQKPVEWSEEDELIATSIIDVLKRFEHLGATDMKIDWLNNKLKSLKPQPHWKPSKENIKDLEWLADLLKDRMGVGFHRLQVLIDELKKL